MIHDRFSTFLKLQDRTFYCLLYKSKYSKLIIAAACGFVCQCQTQFNLVFLAPDFTNTTVTLIIFLIFVVVVVKHLDVTLISSVRTPLFFVGATRSNEGAGMRSEEA